jgi:hypothetical protein
MGNRLKSLLIYIFHINYVFFKEIIDIGSLIFYEIFVFSVLFGGSKMENDNLIFIFVNMLNLFQGHNYDFSFLLLLSQHFFHFYGGISVKSVKWTV